eukprot:scaffold547_cov384-Prasinococcus_capsulatus_cf.AAC.29
MPPPPPREQRDAARARAAPDSRQLEGGHMRYPQSALTVGSGTANEQLSPGNPILQQCSTLSANIHPRGNSTAAFAARGNSHRDTVTLAQMPAAAQYIWQLPQVTPESICRELDVTAQSSVSYSS